MAYNLCALILMDEKFKCLEDLPSHFSSAFMFYEAANSFFVVASRLPVNRLAHPQTIRYFIHWIEVCSVRLRLMVPVRLQMDKWSRRCGCRRRSNCFLGLPRPAAGWCCRHFVLAPLWLASFTAMEKKSHEFGPELSQGENSSFVTH